MDTGCLSWVVTVCFALSFSVASPVCQQHQAEGQPMGKEEGWSHYQLALCLVYCGLAAYACSCYLCEKGRVLSKQLREWPEWSQDWSIQTLCWNDPTEDQWKCKFKKKKNDLLIIMTNSCGSWFCFVVEAQNRFWSGKLWPRGCLGK